MADNLWLQEMSWAEVRTRLEDTDAVIIPAGSTEQHGPHLPLGVDAFIPIEAAKRVSERTGVPIAPPVWLAPCEWHMGFAGTISIRPTTAIALFNDICRSLFRHGFRNFIVINGHTGGYNPALLSAADEFQADIPEGKIWVVDVFAMAATKTLEVCEAELLYHGDELEASLMMVSRPDLVDLKKARKILPPPPKSRFLNTSYRTHGSDNVLFRFTSDDWKELTNEGQLGDPMIASAEKGEAMMATLVDNVVEFVGDLQRSRVDRQALST